MKQINKKFLKDKGDLAWDYYFMSLAKLSALRSKDPNTKVGACIVSDEKYVISVGYNGMPKGYDKNYSIRKSVDNDKIFCWDRPENSDEITKSKYTYVVHAEANAIVNANITNSQIQRGSTIYVTHLPCFSCAKLIVQAKIKKVVYAEDYHSETPEGQASLYIFKEMGVKIEKLANDFDIVLEAK